MQSSSRRARSSCRLQIWSLLKSLRRRNARGASAARAGRITSSLPAAVRSKWRSAVSAVGRCGYSTHDLHKKQVCECRFGDFKCPWILKHLARNVGNFRYISMTYGKFACIFFACAAIHVNRVLARDSVSPAGLSKKNIPPMGNRCIAAGEGACARFGGIMSSQPSNFRGTGSRSRRTAGRHNPLPRQR
jgi:hypothetical protein